MVVLGMEVGPYSVLSPFVAKSFAEQRHNYPYPDGSSGLAASRAAGTRSGAERVADRRMRLIPRALIDNLACFRRPGTCDGPCWSRARACGVWGEVEIRPSCKKPAESGPDTVQDHSCTPALLSLLLLARSPLR